MREAASTAMSATWARSSAIAWSFSRSHLLAGARDGLLGLGAGLAHEVGAHRLGLLDRLREDLLALAARPAQHLLVLGEEVLGLRRRQLRGVHLLADRLLALVDDLEEGPPGELAEDPGEQREDDEGGPQQRRVDAQEAAPAALGRGQGEAHRASAWKPT